MNIASVIQLLRGKGLTQDRIAIAIGVSQSVVSELARGKIGTKRPSYKVVDGIRRLACENGIDPEAQAGPAQTSDQVAA